MTVIFTCYIKLPGKIAISFHVGLVLQYWDLVMSQELKDIMIRDIKNDLFSLRNIDLVKYRLEHNLIIMW